MEFYFYGDLYCDWFTVQGCRLELPCLDSINRFFVKTMAYSFDYANVTGAAVGFDNDT
jgi:hypothetical protein